MNAFGLFQVMDSSDVGVIEGRQHLRFVLETCHPLLIMHKGSGENFDRHLAAESRVFGAIDFTHAAGTQKRKNFVGSDLPSQERFRRFHVSVAADYSTRGKKFGGQTPNFTQGQEV